MSLDPLEIAIVRDAAQIEFSARPIFLPVLNALGGCVELSLTRLSSTRWRVDFDSPVAFFPGLVHPVNWHLEDEDGIAPDLAVHTITPENQVNPAWVEIEAEEQRSGIVYRAVYDTPCT